MIDEKTLMRIQSVINQMSILCDFAEIDADEGDFSRAGAYNSALVNAYDDLNTAYKELMEKTE